MEQLAWLPVHGDIGADLGAARRMDDPAVRLREAVRLAGFRRDFVATSRIDRLAAPVLDAVAGNSAAPDATPGLTRARLAVLSSHSVDHLLPAIRVAGLGRRLALSLYAAPYGQYRQELMDPASGLAAFAPGLVLLALDMHDAPPDLPLHASDDAVAVAVAARVTELRRLWARIRTVLGAQPVQQLFLLPQDTVFGSFDHLVPASPLALATRLNAALVAAARQDGVLLLDLAPHGPALFPGGLADPVRWHQAKQLVGPAAGPLYGDLVARVAAAALGLSRKALVLDLDNTLWGGVIGDDGLSGIVLGGGDPSGEAFAAVQRYAALLAQRGTILAVCSKNDPAVAEEAFARHPEMVLRRSDIAAFVANWTDKATNLRAIARSLDIGLDSLVFVDDNPAERDIVRRELPEVAVPELPEDAAGFPARIAAAGYFEGVSFTSEDAGRSAAYAANAAREEAQDAATDMDSYLRSLEMVLVGGPIGRVDRPRSSQLLNKTNQFNLTTRRMTLAEFEALVDDPGTVSMAFRLRDRFGDNGLISVVLARPDPALPADTLLIHTWLMSCRVLGRQVEAAVLGALATEARRRGVRALVGEYRPSGRNAMVGEHYPKLGFRPVPPPPGAADGAAFWVFDLLSAPVPDHHIREAATP